MNRDTRRPILMNHELHLKSQLQYRRDGFREVFMAGGFERVVDWTGATGTPACDR